MKSIPVVLAAAALIMSGTASAQTATPPGQTSPAPAVTQSAPPPAPPGAMSNMQPSGSAAASGNDNQAVATTNADAPQPAHGANSFSRGEARRRIESHGFQKVSGLRKDSNGVWRGTGMKDGASVQVWLDYKGNAGQM